MTLDTTFIYLLRDSSFDVIIKVCLLNNNYHSPILTPCPWPAQEVLQPWPATEW